MVLLEEWEPWGTTGGKSVAMYNFVSIHLHYDLGKSHHPWKVRSGQVSHFPWDKNGTRDVHCTAQHVELDKQINSPTPMNKLVCRTRLLLPLTQDNSHLDMTPIYQSTWTLQNQLMKKHLLTSHKLPFSSVVQRWDGPYSWDTEKPFTLRWQCQKFKFEEYAVKPFC